MDSLVEGPPQKFWDQPPQSDEEPEPPSVMEGDEASTDEGWWWWQIQHTKLQEGGAVGLPIVKVDWSDWIGFSDDEGVTEPPVPVHESPEAADQDLDGELCF